MGISQWNSDGPGLRRFWKLHLWYVSYTSAWACAPCGCTWWDTCMHTISYDIHASHVDEIHHPCSWYVYFPFIGVNCDWNTPKLLWRPRDHTQPGTMKALKKSLKGSLWRSTAKSALEAGSNLKRRLHHNQRLNRVWRVINLDGGVWRGKVKLTNRNSMAGDVLLASILPCKQPSSHCRHSLNGALSDGGRLKATLCNLCKMNGLQVCTLVAFWATNVGELSSQNDNK